MESSNEILLGTIGYHLLANHSIGPLLIDDIGKLDWTQENIDVEEMNWGPIAIVQKFQAGDVNYKRVVFLTAIERVHRKTGDLTIYKWGGRLPSEEDIQACVGDAVTGVISSENLLIIGEHFKVWPEEVYLFDVDPGPEQAGIELSPEVSKQVPYYFDKLKEICLTGTCDDVEMITIYGDQIMSDRLAGDRKSAWHDN